MSDVEPHDDVLRFWFVETAPARWWSADAAFDASIDARFGAVLRAAERGELWRWRASPRGRLAEVIVLDQFSRNLHRGTARAFANDPMALVLAQEAVSAGCDAALEPAQRAFLYMPFVHSESALIHAEAARLFAMLGQADSEDSARRHKAIVDRFGRYPHRNELLGRVSTDAELAFLREPGSRF